MNLSTLLKIAPPKTSDHAAISRQFYSRTLIGPHYKVEEVHDLKSCKTESRGILPQRQRCSLASVLFAQRVDELVRLVLR